MSSGLNAYKMSRIHPVELVFPFFTFTLHIIKLIAGLTLTQKLRIFCILVKLNITGAFDKAYSHLYFIYKKLTKSKDFL